MVQDAPLSGVTLGVPLLAWMARELPLIDFENRQCGLRACKTVMMEGDIIGSDRVRHPLVPLPSETRARLLATAAEYDRLALRRGR